MAKTRGVVMRAGLYGRVSTVAQTEPEATSLENQERRCRAYAEAQGWEVAGSFIDTGVSGSLALRDRPEGKRLMAAVEAGDINVVVVLKVDRMTRNLRRGAETIGRLEELGCGFVSVEEQWDTTNPAGRMMLNLLMVFADFERERIRERMADGRRGKAARFTNEDGLVTKWIGGLTPLGYTTDDEGTLIEDIEHSSTVRRIFALRAARESTLNIARKLQAEGIQPRPRDGAVDPFSDEMVRKVLKTTAYLSGEYARKLEGKDKEPTRFAVPVLIDPALWAAAHSIPKGKVHSNTGRRVNEYGIAGRVSHIHDDGSVSGMFGQVRKTSAGLSRFYRCSSSRKRSTMPAWCSGFGVARGIRLTAVSADVLDAAFLLWFLNTVEDPKTLAAYAEHADRLLLAENGDSPDDLDAHRKRLERLEVKRGRYADSYAEGLMTKEAFTDRVTGLDAEAETLKAVIERAADLDDRREDLAASILSIGDLFAMEIVNTGEGDPARDEPITGAQLREELRRVALKSLEPADRYGRTPALPPWAVAEVQKFVAAFGAEVSLTAAPEGDDPQRPNIRIEFSPTAPLHQDMLCTSTSS